MKRFWLRAQLIYIAVIPLLTIALVMALVMRWNIRWDMTPGKMYSIAAETQHALKTMNGELQIIAFYPHDDPARNNFEVFLKQCQIAQPGIRFSFYDPDRVPLITKKFNIKETYTVLMSYGGHRERLIQPTEESFTNALIRLISPQKQTLCFVTGHGEASLGEEGRQGYWAFGNALRENNYDAKEIILTRDRVPAACSVVVVAGPHHDFKQDEFEILVNAYQAGKGILFLIDPMDAGEGKAFTSFFKKFGIDLGINVIVDKASRLVGGDFLVALVSQYMIHHPITKEFNQPTFFPVSRSVQSSQDIPDHSEVTPLALSSSESWAETNLEKLEKGEANFDSAYDLLGPVSIAAAAENLPFSPTDKKNASSNKNLLPATGKGGRIVVIGDSDFLTNAYLDLSGNTRFALNALQWLAKDERLIDLRPRNQKFQPMLLNHRQRVFLMLMAIAIIPVIIFLTGCVRVIYRKRAS